MWCCSFCNWGFLTNILVLLAEAFHTLSDAMISVFLLLALLWSEKPADDSHMFAHEKAQNAAALVSAPLFISFMSLEMIRQAVAKLSQDVHEFQNINVAFVVTITAMIVNAIPLSNILRAKMRGASTSAQLMALTRDEISYVAALLGVALVAQGYSCADPLAFTRGFT